MTFVHVKYQNLSCIDTLLDTVTPLWSFALWNTFHTRSSVQVLWNWSGRLYIARAPDPCASDAKGNTLCTAMGCAVTKPVYVRSWTWEWTVVVESHGWTRRHDGGPFHFTSSLAGSAINSTDKSIPWGSSALIRFWKLTQMKHLN